MAINLDAYPPKVKAQQDQSRAPASSRGEEDGQGEVADAAPEKR